MTAVMKRATPSWHKTMAAVLGATALAFAIPAGAARCDASQPMPCCDHGAGMVAQKACCEAPPVVSASMNVTAPGVPAATARAVTAFSSAEREQARLGPSVVSLRPPPATILRI